MTTPTITVFTPAYNRANTLTRLFNSLLAQTSYDFEWIIIDDGSTDGTEDIVKYFTAPFDIRYTKKENGGKHTAYNLALTQAHGKLFLCVDSDDILEKNAVKKLCLNAETEIGLCAYKSDFDGKLLGDVFPSIVNAVSVFELNNKLGCRGEYTFVYPTEAARKVPFPVFPGEKFVTESVIYDKLDKYCPVKLLPEIITICEYQPNGYSADTNKLMRENPAGYCLYFMQRIDLVSWRQRFIFAGKYHCFAMMAGKRSNIYTGQHQATVALCRPLGLLFRLYYRIFRGF